MLIIVGCHSNLQVGGGVIDSCNNFQIGTLPLLVSAGKIEEGEAVRWKRQQCNEVNRYDQHMPVK